MLILILWSLIPFAVEKIIYKNTNKNLLEKRDTFIKNINKSEIQEFLIANDTAQVYGNFSNLHNEFIQLKKIDNDDKRNADIFYNSKRLIEKETSEYRILQHHFNYKNSIYQLEIGSNINEISDLESVLHLFIIITFLILSILTFLVDNFYVGFLLKPLKEIVETKIKLINNPEKFSQNPVETTSIEFKDLDLALTQMMHRIKELFLKEKQFIGNVSHELLTPISILKNRFENLIQNQSLNDNAVDKISDSLSTLDAMKKVIQNLLLISRIDNKQYKIDETIDFQILIPELIINLEDRIQEKNLFVTENINYNMIFEGNKTLIQILINNLLNNAIKYNNQNGSIIIKDEFINNNYILSISDSGFGMTKAQINTIFERFTRIHFNQEGNGIGLAIVDSIAHLHNIKIDVLSEVNHGTSFVLTFANVVNTN